MPIVTIRGQMGSGAPDIGRQIAAKLNIDYIDREIIAKVAKQTQWAKQIVAEKEKPPGTLLGRIAEALGRGSTMMGVEFSGAYMPVYDIPLDNDSYVKGLESVIKKLAQKKAIVIRGRGSQFILKDILDAFHILIVATEEIRIKRIISSLKLNEDEAKKEINRSDSSHREFIKRYFKSDLEDPVNYDIVVNTSVLDFKDATVIILKALQLKMKAIKKQTMVE